MTDTYDFDLTGNVYSINAADGLEPFKTLDFPINSRTPVTNGTIVEVDSSGMFIRTLANIGPDGEFSFKDKRDTQTIRVRVFSTNHACIDRLFHADATRLYLETYKLYSPLFNANQHGVPFVHWRSQAGNSPEYIFREDGFFSAKTVQGAWTPIGRYRTSYSQSNRGYHISTQPIHHHIENTWTSPSNDRPFFIVDAAQILNVWIPSIQNPSRWQLQHI